MPRKAKRDDAEDVALWQHAMRNVKPLVARPPPPPAPLKPPEPSAISHPTLQPASLAQPQPALDRFAGLDRASGERLKRGKLPIEGRLDLHGMTQQEAYRTLAGFIRGAHAAGKRCVLVITGRGSLGGGVLRAAVPRWLDEPEFRPYLLAISTAQPRDGGSGALYVMLRRTRAG